MEESLVFCNNLRERKGNLIVIVTQLKSNHYNMQQVAKQGSLVTSLKEGKLHEELYESPTFRGGVVGAFITAFVSWNTGRLGRIGGFMKRWRFIRYFVSPKPLPKFCPITKYHHPCLDIAANNFYCYSGESGVGKTRHFQELIYEQSFKRPSLYISFKAVGREVNFEIDLAEQLNYGETSVRGGIMGEVVRAVKKIQQINQSSVIYRMKYFLINVCFLGVYGAISIMPPFFELQAVLYCATFFTQCYYLYFMGPLIRQSIRKTIPIIVFDDVNKLQHLGMLAEITRFFKTLEAKAANLMLISSNEETWSKLRRQPGMRDRLRVHQIKYNHSETARLLIQLIDTNPSVVQKFFTAYPLFNLALIKELARIFIGVKQMSIRRFSSALKLVDEEEYQKLVQILKNQKQLCPIEVVNEIKEVIFHTEVHTMVTHFRSIKRELQSMSQREFIDALDVAVTNQKLPSDSKVGALLKVYNIMRDLRSQYVINGGYMLKIFEMAFEEYKLEMEQYDLPVYRRDDYY